MADLSIIIVSYKGWARLTRCLEALNSFTGKTFTTEVIVVDNRSDDGAIFKMEKQFPEFRFIFNNINGGFANGCNLGAGNSKGEYLLFLNPDTVASEAEIEKLIDNAKQISEMAIISCRQVNEKGKECVVTGSFPEFYNLTGFQRAIFRDRSKRFIIEETTIDNDVLFPDWVSGSVIMMGKKVFEKLKGFDEDFWMYFEDVDICKRAFDNGIKVRFHNNVTIEHNHGGSSRASVEATVVTKTEVYVSKHVYISKHKHGIGRILIQGFLVINNIISGFLMALTGLLFFFIPKLSVRTLVYLRLINYYFLSLRRHSWISKRSVNYLKSHAG